MYCNVCVHHRNKLFTSTLITVNVIADSLTHNRALILSDKHRATSCRLIRAEVSHSPDHAQDEWRRKVTRKTDNFQIK